MAKGFVGVTTPRPKRQNTLDVSSALGNREHPSLALPYHALRRTAESPELRRATIAFLSYSVTGYRQGRSMSYPRHRSCASRGM